MKYRLLYVASMIVFKLYLFFYRICHKLEQLHYRIYVQIFREDEVADEKEQN